MKAYNGGLKIEPASKDEFLLFSFLEFRFFWNSPDGKAIPVLLGNSPLLAPLVAVPYMFAASVYNFRGAKYFIREENEVVGILILKIRGDALFVQSLAVSPTKRKRGVGFLVLVQVEESAKRLRLRWLELEVLKGNVAAQRLYWKFGFRFYFERGLTLVLRKRV